MGSNKNNAQHQATYRKRQKSFGNSRKYFYINSESSRALQSKKQATGKSIDLLINEAVSSAYLLSTLHDAELKQGAGLDKKQDEKITEQSWEELKL